MTNPEQKTLHGVFLEVFNIGVLLTGKSGIGKSEIAMSLVNRGHTLVADDATTLSAEDNKIIGTCPERLRDFLEVRGLGLLNIRKMYGDNSVKSATQLQLIINLVDITSVEVRDSDRLAGIHSTEDFFGIGVPKVVLPVGPGRHLSVLIESAVRSQKLKIEEGYDPVEDFCQRNLEERV